MIPPLDELVNTFEFEAAAKQKLAPAAFALIEGSDRRPFERITFRPRLMVNTTKLDLRLDLFGVNMLAPIIAGPVSNLTRFHATGDAAFAKGASEAKALFVVAEPNEFPAGAADWWYQTGSALNHARLAEAIERGCKAICVSQQERAALPAIRRLTKLPIVLKGVTSADQARRAASQGADAIIVSSYGAAQPGAQPMEVLPAIVDAVGGRIPVLIDGGFRRGTDILMALALGAKAVLVARPVIWGLAAYGADGVRAVTEMLQTELARNMAMCGKADLRSLDRSLVKIHTR